VALAVIMIALVISVRDVVLRRDLRRHVVRVAFSPDGKTLGAAVFSGRDVQLSYPTPRIVCHDQQMAFYLWDASSPSSPSIVERKGVRGPGIWWAAETHVSGPSIAFSPDGRSFATANGVYEVALWTLDGKKRLHAFRADDELLCAVAFTPDGRDLIAGGMNGVHVWHIAEPDHECLWINGQVSVFSLAISPDGKYLLSSDNDGRIELWSLQLGRHVCRVATSDNVFQLLPVAFSPDGRLLAAAAGVVEADHIRPQVKLWDAATKNGVQSFETDLRFPYNVAFAPDGNTLFADNGGGTLLLNDLRTGKQRAIGGHPTVRSVAISPDGQKLATGDYGGTVVLRDIHSMKGLARWRLPDGAPPYWLIPVGAFFLWAFLWFKVGSGNRQRECVPPAVPRPGPSRE
jgi:WD40 repeat protein